MLRQIMGSFFGILLFSGPAVAQTAACPSYPYSFSSGSNAVAAQVNGNFSYILSCYGNLVSGASSGATLSGVTLTGMTMSTGLLGIGMPPSNVLDITQNANSTATGSISNPNSGTDVAALWQATNGAHIGIFGQTGVNFSASGLAVADQSFLEGDGVGGILINNFIAAPIIFGINDTAVGRFDANGRFLLGYSADQGGGQKLQVDSGVLINGTAQFPGVGTIASGASAVFDGSNNLLKVTSSIRYKRDIRPISYDDARKVLNLTPVSFHSTSPFDDPKRVFEGLTAEQVAQYLPQFVNYIKDNGGKDIPDGVQYDRIAAVALLAVVKEQQNEIDALKSCRLWCMVKQAIGF